MIEQMMRSRSGRLDLLDPVVPPVDSRQTKTESRTSRLTSLRRQRQTAARCVDRVCL